MAPAAMLRGLAGNHFLQAGALTAVPAAAGAAGLHATGRPKQGNELAAAGLGGWIGHGVYQSPAMLDQMVLRPRRQPLWMRREVKQSQLASRGKKLKREFEAERRHWLAGARDPLTGEPNRAKQWRNYPKHWPGARAERLQGWTHNGRTGQLVGGAFTVGGALGGVAAVRRHKRKSGTSKRLLESDSRVSPTKVVEFGAGVGALAYGGPRLKMVGRALERGRPGAKINTAVERALRQAEGVRSLMEHATDPLGRVTGRGIGRMPASVRNAIDRVPRDLRPATATLAGAILVSHARPVRQTSYRVVN